MLRVTAPGDPAVVVAHERGGEPLLEALHLVVLHQLLVEHVQQRLAGDVGHVVGAGGRRAAEGAGAELALLVAVEGHAQVLEVEHLVGRLAAHDLDGVLVAQVVRALDGVERVRLPRVLGVERGVDAARRRVGVRADGVDLGDDPHGGAGLRRGEGGALAGESGSDDEDVVLGHGLVRARAILSHVLRDLVRAARAGGADVGACGPGPLRPGAARGAPGPRSPRHAAAPPGPRPSSPPGAAAPRAPAATPAARPRPRAGAGAPSASAAITDATVRPARAASGTASTAGWVTSPARRPSSSSPGTTA